MFLEKYIHEPMRKQAVTLRDPHPIFKTLLENPEPSHAHGSRPDYSDSDVAVEIVCPSTLHVRWIVLSVEVNVLRHANSQE